MTALLGLIGGIVFLVNIPFGYWRANVRRLSGQWFMAVHLPVPIVVLLRVASHLGWQVQTFLVLVGFYGAGQFLGGQIRRSIRSRSIHPLSSCLVMDLFRNLVER